MRFLFSNLEKAKIRKKNSRILKKKIFIIEFLERERERERNKKKKKKLGNFTVIFHT